MLTNASSAPARSLQRERLCVALLFLGYLAYGLLVFNRTSELTHDDGFVPFLAHLMNRGLVPYRDLFLTLTPATLFVQSWLQREFSYELIVGRWYVLIEHLVLFVLIWRVSLRAIPAGWGRICPLALLFFGPLFSHPFFSLDALVISYLSLLLVLRYLDGGQAWNLYLGGLTAGLTLLFKQNIGAATVAFVVGTTLWAGLTGGRAYARLPGVMAALMAPLALFGGYLLSTGSLRPFVDNVLGSAVSLKGPLVPGNLSAFLVPNRFGAVLLCGLVCGFVIGFSRRWQWRASAGLVALVGVCLVAYEASSRADGLPHLWLWIQAGVGDLIMKIPAAVCVLAGRHAAQPTTDGAGNERRTLVILTSFSSLHLAAAAAAGGTWYHLSLAFPFVYVLMGWMFFEVVGKPDRLAPVRSAERALTDWKAGAVRLVPLAATVTLIIYGLTINVYAAAFGTRRDAVWSGNPVKALLAMSDPGLPGLKGMRISSEERDLLASIKEYVDVHSVPSVEILAFPMGTPLYAVTRRVSTSYYSHFYVEGAAQDWNARTIAYLKTRRPRYVILCDIPADSAPARVEELLSVGGRVRELLDYVRSHFFEAARFGRYVILQNRDDTVSEPITRTSR